MSIEAIARVLNLEMSDPSAKLVLIGLANHTGPTGQCYPSVRLLMKYSGLSERAVRATIKRLETDGYIKVERRTGTSSLYFLGEPLQLVQGGGADFAGGEVQQLHPNRNNNRKTNASDARAGLSTDWRPDNFSEIETQYPGIDVDHQLALFIADNNANATVLANPEAAFSKWMLRTKDLKTPPKARATAPAPGSGAGPEPMALTFERDAIRDERMWKPDEASEAWLNAAKLHLKDGQDGDARRCALAGWRAARKDSWHQEQVEHWAVAQWGEDWRKE